MGNKFKNKNMISYISELFQFQMVLDNAVGVGGVSPGLLILFILIFDSFVEKGIFIFE